MLSVNQLMLKITELRLTLTVTNQSKCMVLYPIGYNISNCASCKFFLDEKPIANEKSFIHLGYVISGNLLLNDRYDLNLRCTDFVRHANNVLCYFTKLSPRVKYCLFQL